MTLNSILQILFYFVFLCLLTKPIGWYMARVYQGPLPWGVGFLKPIETLCYRLAGIDETKNMNWVVYARNLIAFSVVGCLLSYVLLRMQAFLPFNPKGFSGQEMTPDLAFNTAVSFTTNTNWQSYSPEVTISYFSNMVSLAIHNWMSAAVGMAIAVAVIRGFSQNQEEGIGNFWVDILRSSLYILFPIALFSALIFVWSGVPQNFLPYQSAKGLEGFEQVIAQGPVASQEAIKQLGTNGGGFFNANSAHPYENPTPFSNLISILLIFLIPAGFTSLLGVYVGNPRQGWAIFAAMSFLFLLGAFVCVYCEQTGTPHLKAAGVQILPGSHETGGNMEGKETRFGITQSALFATVTTDASCGAVNAMHDSFTPLGGLVPLFNILTGEVIFGGVGAGMYGILLFAVLTVFIAGLMVGRTPEYLGKKIQTFEVQMAMFAVLLLAASILGFTSLASVLDLGKESLWNRVGLSSNYLGAMTANLNNGGPHGFTEALYAYTSATGNNGSAFAGITANTPIYNLTLGIAMLIGRFLMIIPLLAMAGSLSKKKRVELSSGTFPTDNLTFAGLLVAVIVIVNALTFFPALALGPIVEHFQMLKGILH